MKLACERCQSIIDDYLDKYEIVNRGGKIGANTKIVLCKKCSKDFDDFLYEKSKTFNDCEQSYLQSAT